MGRPGRDIKTYRQKEMKLIAQWLEAGESGAVVGIAGSGKGNLLNFLCRYPQAVTQHFHDPEQRVIPIYVDLNTLPAYDLATFYRVILRSMAEVQDMFDSDLQPQIVSFYQENKREQDPFLPQSALLEILTLLKARKIRVALILDRFGYFFEMASPHLLNTLRGVRNMAKRTLCYIIGLTQDYAHLPYSPELMELRGLVDGPICWVGTMTEQDARQMIKGETYVAPQPPSRTEESAMLTLTGHHPALLKATCGWWRLAVNKPDIRQWRTLLLADQGIQNRLDALWRSFTQEEKLLLYELEQAKRSGSKTARRQLERDNYPLLSHLDEMGLCYKQNNGWHIKGDLLAEFVVKAKEQGRGRIWWEEATKTFWQGDQELQLTDQQTHALSYFCHHPRECLTKLDLIMEFWPHEWQEVDDARLFQLIRQVRQRIEPNPSNPCYLITSHARPDGGYQFFPEGRSR